MDYYYSSRRRDCRDRVQVIKVARITQIGSYPRNLEISLVMSIVRSFDGQLPAENFFKKITTLSQRPFG